MLQLFCLLMAYGRLYISWYWFRFGFVDFFFPFLHDSKFRFVSEEKQKSLHSLYHSNIGKRSGRRWKKSKIKTNDLIIGKWNAGMIFFFQNIRNCVLVGNWIIWRNCEGLNEIMMEKICKKKNFKRKVTIMVSCFWTQRIGRIVIQFSNF